jgi:hypothetical protein
MEKSNSNINLIIYFSILILEKNILIKINYNTIILNIFNLNINRLIDKLNNF